MHYSHGALAKNHKKCKMHETIRSGNLKSGFYTMAGPPFKKLHTQP
jgi:hypothetical protein